MIVVRLPPLAHFRMRALEWGLAAITFTISLALFQDYPTFEQAALADMARMAPEVFWQWALFFVGTARLIALWVNGSWRRSPWIRAFTSLMCAVVWMQITLGLLHVNMVTIGIGIFPWFLVAEGYSMWRAVNDAKEAHEAKKAANKSPPVLVVPE